MINTTHCNFCGVIPEFEDDDECSECGSMLTTPITLEEAKDSLMHCCGASGGTLEGLSKDNIIHQRGIFLLNVSIPDSNTDTCHYHIIIVLQYMSRFITN